MANQNERAVAMLEAALAMEEKGESFYEKSARGCANELGREIFGQLMKDELVHIERIKGIYSSLKSGKRWTDDWKKAGGGLKRLGSFFEDFAKKQGPQVKAETSDLDALGIGIDLEQRSIKFYQDERAKASDPLEREFIERMVVEEKHHFEMLTETKYYLEDPSSYFSEKERSGYDGA